MTTCTAECRSALRGASHEPHAAIVSLSDEGRRCAFRIRWPAARAVQLVGDFNRWTLPGIAMTPDGAGGWQATVELRPGRHRYAFYVTLSYRYTADAPWGQSVWWTDVETVEVEPTGPVWRSAAHAGVPAAPGMGLDEDPSTFLG